MTDTIYSIHQSAKKFFSGTLLSRISGMLRDILMAFFFGTHPAVAAFMLAFRFSHLLRRLFGEGALQSAFIPAFEDLRHQDPKRAFLFFKDLHRLLVLFLSLLIILAEISLALFLKYLHLSPANQQVIVLTMWMLPSLLFICLYGLNTSLLQCQKIYFLSSVAPVVFNIVWIVSLVGIYSLPMYQAMQGLSIAVVIACIFQWLVTYPSVQGILKENLSSVKKSFIHFSDTKAILKPLCLGILGIAASQINNALDMLFARYAQSDGPAILWYAIRIQQLPLALFGISVAGAVLPPLTRALKAQQLENYHHFLEEAWIQTWRFMLFFSTFLFCTGDACINFLYGHGQFTFHSVLETTYCLWGYTLGLLPSALTLVLAPVCYAHHNYKLPAFASLASMCINAFLNYLFIFSWEWGPFSVAVATSISAWINCLFLSLALLKFHPLRFSYLLKKTIDSLTICLCTGVIVYVFRYFFDELNSLPRSFTAQFSILCYLSFIFFLPYSIYSYFIYLKPFLYNKIITKTETINNH